MKSSHDQAVTLLAFVERGALNDSAADAFLQAATQAPQPMQAAASMALSAAGLGTGTALASGLLPVRTEMKPPAATMRSNDVRSTTNNVYAEVGSAINQVQNDATASVHFFGKLMKIAFIAAIVAAVVAVFKRRRGKDLDEDEWQELPPPAGG